MRAPYTAGWQGGVALVVWLGVLLSLAGPAQGQERAPEPGATPAALEEAKRLNTQATRLYNEGKYHAAIPLVQRVLAIREQVLGPNHPEVATTLNNLAVLYQAQGDYRQAAPLHQRALAIRKQVLGSNHPDVAITLNNLAGLYRAQGDYRQAAPLYQRALAIWEQTLGPEHPEVATALNNLAELYHTQGDYRQAAPLLQRALAIREQALGPNHPEVATTLNNLAGLYHTQGDYRQAAPLLQRALAIREQVLGPEHPEVAITVNNLAGLYRAQGHYRQAALLYQRALAIQEQALGPKHPHIAGTLNNLAELYQAQGDYGQAEPLHQRALAIREQGLGPNHPEVAITLNNLAGLYRAQGHYRQAALLHQRALAIQEQALGTQHPHVATTLNNLAGLYQAQGDAARAVAFRSRGNDIHEHTLTSLLTTGAEAQKQAYLATLEGATSATVSLHTQDAPHNPDALRLALTTVLRRKGRVLDAMTDTLTTLRRHLGTAEQALLEQWTAARTQLATLMLRGPGAQDPAVYRGQIAELEAQAQALEAQLSARSAVFRTQTAPVTLAAVQQALPPDAVLVEVVWYRPFQPRAASATQYWGAARYVAYVLRHQDVLQWVDLGEADRIDREVMRLRRELSCADDGTRQDAERVRERCLTRLPQTQMYARILDEKIMRPLRPLLGDAHLLLLVPDGALNLLPFGTLVDEHNQYLIERFTVSYLTSGRDLLRLQTKFPGQHRPLVVANPAFENAGSPAAVPMAAAERRSPALRSMDFATMRFAPLPGTAAEASALQRLLPETQILTGTDATESALKQIHGPRLLHVATHGFFLAGQPQREQREGIGFGTVVSGEPARLWAEHPLLRSGLALAGANALRSGTEDGVLTALEAAGLDLLGTQLVVLSACETGVGTVQNGEGVYGLRRALVMAGAESQVMSLWKVDDAATREFMVAYYTQLLAGKGRAEALRQTQLALLAHVEQRHPFFWASFIPTGEWRPLEYAGSR